MPLRLDYAHPNFTMWAVWEDDEPSLPVRSLVKVPGAHRRTDG